MKRRWIALGAVAAMAGAVALLRDPGRMDAELASALFTAPVQALVAEDRLLPPRPPEPVTVFEGSRLALRVDGGEGGFGRIVDVAPSRGGDTLYVLDGMAGSVSAFRPDGEWLFRFGAKGGGPGEFRKPAAVMVLPWSGEVAVWDEQSQRLCIHTPSGREVRRVAPALGPRGGLVHRVQAVEGGFVAEVRSDPLRVRPGEQRGELVRLDTAGRATAALLRFALPGVDASHREPSPGSSVTTVLHPPTWSPEPRWDARADGSVVFAPGGPDEAYRISPSGRVVRLRRPAPAARVTRQDRLRHLDGQRQRRLIASPTASLRLLEPLNRRHYASVRPAVTGVIAGPGGEAWTRPFDTGESWRGFSRVWDVAGEDGAVRRVRMPAAFEPLHANGGLLYGVAADGLDVERVEAYRLGEP